MGLESSDALAPEAWLGDGGQWSMAASGPRHAVQRIVHDWAKSTPMLAPAGICSVI